MYELSLNYYEALLDMTKRCSIPLFDPQATTTNKLHNIFYWAISNSLGLDLLDNIRTFDFTHPHSFKLKGFQPTSNMFGSICF